jgi:hypothetical protein
MVYPDCPIHIYDAVGRFITPLLCFLYRVANEGHALGASIGIPDCMSWFSTPDLFRLQFMEAGVFLMFLAFPVLALIDMLGPRDIRGWDWKTDARLIGWLGLMGWLEVCLVRSLYLSGGKHLGGY